MTTVCYDGTSLASDSQIGGTFKHTQRKLVTPLTAPMRPAMKGTGLGDYAWDLPPTVAVGRP